MKKGKNSLIKWITISILLTVTFASCQSKMEPNFTLSDSEFSEAIFSIYQVTPDEAMEWMYDSSMAVFVDLRSAKEFNKGHLENAIHIPTRDLLLEESIANFDQWLEDSIPVVLYGNTYLASNSPWMLMYQLGYTNTRALLGGYDYIDKLYLDMLDGETFEPELPAFDYAGILEEVKNSEPEIKEETVVKKVKVKKVVKKESEGGC